MRASGDPNFQRLQTIARLHPRKYEANFSLIDEFWILLVSLCTFVDDWSSPEITSNTYRLYGKKILRKRQQEIILLK